MVGIDEQGCSRLNGRERQPPPQYEPEMRENCLLKSALSLFDELGNAKR